MRRILTAAVFAVLALPLQAETPMTATEFEAFSNGKTLAYARDGVIFGTEVYRPDHKVIWAFTKDTCRDGYWYEDGGAICFVYEDPNDPQCWLYFQRADGVWAQYLQDPPEDPLAQAFESPEPLSCLGPEVGA